MMVLGSASIMLGVCYILSMTRWVDLPMVCAWSSHMVLGRIVFSPWYVVHPAKGTTVMF